MTRPLAVFGGRASDAGFDLFRGWNQAGSLVAENRRLAEQQLSATMYREQIQRLDGEVESLRRALGFPDLPGKRRVPAQVIGFFPRDNRITLDVGASSGVVRGQPVQNADGLVGLVQTVGPSECQVLLLTSSSSVVGAIDSSRNPPPAGLLLGDNGTGLVMTFKDLNAPAQSGDTVMTTGFSDRIPRGIPIGRIVQVIDDPDYGSRSATIDPLVSLGTLREVWVIE